MESVRTSSPSASAGTSGSRPVRQGGKPTGNDGLSPTQGPQDAFAALMAALGQDALQLPPDAALGMDAQGQAPEQFLGDSGDSTGNSLNPLFTGLAATTQGQGSLPSLGTATGPGGQALDLGSMDLTSLVAQTTWLDKAAERTGGMALSENAALDNPMNPKPQGARPMGFAGAPSALAAPMPGASAGLSKALQAAMSMVQGGSSAAGPSTPPLAGTALPSQEMFSAAGAGPSPSLAGMREITADLASWTPTVQMASESRPGAGAQPPQSSNTAEAVNPGGESSAGPLHAIGDSSSISADGMGAAGDEQMADQLAEQMAYWVSQDGQSAQLTLDRDGEPVQVRVVLSGNEAHVTFSSDQAHTRQALDASTAQLRDMLEAQGLVLAGVTVGQGGAEAQGGGRQEGKSARNGATASVGGVATGPSTAALVQDRLGQVRPGPSTRGLDLFV